MLEKQLEFRKQYNLRYGYRSYYNPEAFCVSMKIGADRTKLESDFEILSEIELGDFVSMTILPNNKQKYLL